MVGKELEFDGFIFLLKMGKAPNAMQTPTYSPRYLTVMSMDHANNLLPHYLEAEDPPSHSVQRNRQVKIFGSTHEIWPSEFFASLQ